MMRSIKSLSQACAVAALFSGAVAAHSLYLMPSTFHTDGDEIIFSVHNGDSFPLSEEAADPNRITNATTVCADIGQPIPDFKKLGKAIHGAAMLEPNQACWITVSTLPRELEMDPAKFEKYLLDEGLDSVVAWRAAHGKSEAAGRERYRKFAKSFVTAGHPEAGSWKQIAQPLGLPIEFIPQADIAALAPGDELPVIVLRDGKPLAGVRVESAWATAEGDGINIVGRTDDEGRISVPLDRAARWRLHTVTMEPLPEGETADWHSYWASLTFEVR